MLRRVEALDDYTAKQRGYPEHLMGRIRACHANDRGVWDRLKYQVGRLLIEDMSSLAARMTWDGFEAYWQDWKAATRVRASIDHAQHNPRPPGSGNDA